MGGISQRNSRRDHGFPYQGTARIVAKTSSRDGDADPLIHLRARLYLAGVRLAMVLDETFGEN
jgi:hypothetical protein